MAADALRKRILQNIETELEKILKSNGFHNNVEKGSVRRTVGSYFTLKEHPSLFIVAGVETALDNSPGLTLWQLTVVVEAHIRVKDVVKLADDTEDILSDVRKAMHLDTTRGGNAIDTTTLGAEPPTIIDTEDLKAAVRTDFMITFRTDRDNPETQSGC